MQEVGFRRSTLAGTWYCSKVSKSFSGMPFSPLLAGLLRVSLLLGSALMCGGNHRDSFRFLNIVRSLRADAAITILFEMSRHFQLHALAFYLSLWRLGRFFSFVSQLSLQLESMNHQFQKLVAYSDYVKSKLPAFEWVQRQKSSSAIPRERNHFPIRECSSLLSHTIAAIVACIVAQQVKKCSAMMILRYLTWILIALSGVLYSIHEPNFYSSSLSDSCW